MHPLSLAVPILAGALVASLWQGTLVVLLMGLLLRLLPDLSAAARSMVWAVGLLLLTANLLWLLAGGPHEGLAPGAGLHLQRWIGIVIVGAWVLATAWRAGQLAVSAGQLWFLLHSAQPLAPPAGIAGLLNGAGRRPELYVSSRIDRPCVAGFWRPRLLLPADLLPALDGNELIQIVLHELEHLRRRDDWVHLLAQLTLVLFPFHPAMFLLNRRLAVERELACDDAVLRFTQARKSYATCLAHVAEHSLLRRGMALVLGALGSPRRPSDLSARVDRILHGSERSLAGMRARVALFAVLAGAASVSAVLVHSPQLVSFSPAVMAVSAAVPSDPALAATPNAGAAPRMVPVLSVAPSRPAARTTLVKALLPLPVQVLLPLAGSSRPHRATAPRTLRALRAKARRAAVPRVVLTGYTAGNSVDSTATHSVTLEFTPRLVPLVVETQQVWYTAVPFRDGWLVVQL